MAGVPGVPVIVACVAVEQSIPATTHPLNDTGARRNGRYVFGGNCRYHMQLQISFCYDQHFGFVQYRTHSVHFCNLPKSPLSRVNERLVNMHSNATRWNTLLTVLCVPTIRTYLRHSHYQMLVSRKTKRHLILTDEEQPFGQYHHFSMTPSFIKGEFTLFI